MYLFKNYIQRRTTIIAGELVAAQGGSGTAILNHLLRTAPRLLLCRLIFIHPPQGTFPRDYLYPLPHPPLLVQLLKGWSRADGEDIFAANFNFKPNAMTFDGGSEGSGVSGGPAGATSAGNKSRPPSVFRNPTVEIEGVLKMIPRSLSDQHDQMKGEQPPSRSLFDNPEHFLNVCEVRCTYKGQTAIAW